MLGTVGAGAATELTAQQGRLRPQSQPGQPPTAFVFLEEGFLLQMRAAAGHLVVFAARPVPSDSGAEPPVREGDLVLRIADQRISDVGGVERHLDTLAEGDALPLMIQREGEPFEAVYHVTTIQALLASGQMRMELGGDHPTSGAGSRPSLPAGTEWTSAAPSIPREPPLEFVGNRVEMADDGALIVTFRARHPAAASVGLQLGDQILSVNGDPVRGLRRLREILEATPGGLEVILSIVRDGARTELRFTMPTGGLTRSSESTRVICGHSR